MMRFISPKSKQNRKNFETPIEIRTPMAWISIGVFVVKSYFARAFVTSFFALKLDPKISYTFALSSGVPPATDKKTNTGRYKVSKLRYCCRKFRRNILKATCYEQNHKRNQSDR